MIQQRLFGFCIGGACFFPIGAEQMRRIMFRDEADLARGRARTVDNKRRLDPRLGRERGFERAAGIVLANEADENALRAKAREVGGELHIAKNTLLGKALQTAGYEGIIQPTGTTLCAFAFDDAPSMAKVLQDALKESKEELFKVKMGYLDGQAINADQVKALADLPPLPVMRATLLGTIMAPASKLVRTLAEPGRQIAAVIKARSEKDAVPA